MKKKTIWSLALALALVVTVIGASTAALAAAPDTAEPATAIATENEDAIWEQIETLEAKSDAIFQRNAALWEKVDEAAMHCQRTITLRALTKRSLSVA